MTTLRRAAVLICLLASTALVAAQAPDARRAMLQSIEARGARYGDLSRQIWEFAEVGYKETKSSALLRDELKAAGFAVQEGVAGMPTAFVATWGSGKPVIGLMGEFDALPGLSKEVLPEHQPSSAGAPGHGC